MRKVKENAAPQVAKPVEPPAPQVPQQVHPILQSLGIKIAQLEIRNSALEAQLREAHQVIAQQAQEMVALKEHAGATDAALNAAVGDAVKATLQKTAAAAGRPKGNGRARHDA